MILLHCRQARFEHGFGVCSMGEDGLDVCKKERQREREIAFAPPNWSPFLQMWLRNEILRPGRKKKKKNCAWVWVRWVGRRKW